jgi:hypothetical protein
MVFSVAGTVVLDTYFQVTVQFVDGQDKIPDFAKRQDAGVLFEICVRALTGLFERLTG